MIGVVARPEEAEAAAEFFELFKTPWETAVPGRKYPRCHGDRTHGPVRRDVVLAYGSQRQPIDDQTAVVTALTRSRRRLGRFALPLTPVWGISRKAGVVGYRHRAGVTTAIGTTCFPSSLRLNLGQPATFALIPA